MTTTDFKKQIPTYSARRGAFEVVTVPPLQFLMVDGQGDPNTAPAYQDALQTLYPVAYATKFLSRAELDQDFVIMPLEGLWWSDAVETFTHRRDKSRWSWTMMIMVPDWVTTDHLATVGPKIRDAGRAPALDRLRLERMDEGLSVQTLHVGRYDDEGPVLAAMHDAFIPGRSLRMTGRHHEIYLSDARRTAPDKLRTILRQPVAPV